VMTAKFDKRATGGVSPTGDRVAIDANLVTLHIRGPSAVRGVTAALPATGAQEPTAGRKVATIANNLRR